MPSQYCSTVVDLELVRAWPIIVAPVSIGEAERR